MKRIAAYRLTIATTIGLTFSFLCAVGSLVTLGYYSYKKESNLKIKTAHKEVANLIERFNPDERYVIEDNLLKLVNEQREISPVLVRRQYHIGLPKAKKYIDPVFPPRNCFQYLISMPKNIENGDQFCSYFTGDAAPGKYLFFVMQLADDNFIMHQIGSPIKYSDNINLTIISKDRSANWKLTFNLPPISVNSNTFEIGAYKLTDTKKLERDGKIDGWGFIRTQRKGNNIISVIGRISVESIDPSMYTPNQWPPMDFDKLKIKLQRSNISSQPFHEELVNYSDVGSSVLSLSRVATPLFQLRC